MRAKFVMFGITAVAVVALVLQAISQANAQGNANKPAAPARKTKPAAKPPAPPPPTPAQTAAPAEKPAGEKKPVAKKKPKSKKQTAMKGVPSGVPNCLKHLSEMASKDPLPPYEGHPEEIVNNGLMWNDPKSKCSVGSDDAMRKKIADMAKAWRLKDSAQVRALLADLESAAGPK